MFKLRWPTLGGLDCQEDVGVGGEESLEDGYLQLEAVLGRSTRRGEDC